MAEQKAQKLEEARLALVNHVRDRIKPYGTYANNYASGNCTYYVASRVPVPQSMGNANNWAGALAAGGWTVSPTPLVGAIAQTTRGWAGHVALVVAVNGSVVTISEMNYFGLGLIDTQVVPVSDFTYIY